MASIPFASCVFKDQGQVAVYNFSKPSALDRLWTGSRGSMALGPMNSEATDSFID